MYSLPYSNLYMISQKVVPETSVLTPVLGVDPEQNTECLVYGLRIET